MTGSNRNTAKMEPLEQAGLTRAVTHPMTDTAGERTAGVKDADLSALVGYHLKRTFNSIHVDLTEVLAPFGLRMITFTILTMLKENPGLRPSMLANSLEMEKPNLVALVDALEKEGLLRRDRDPQDGRARQLNLTAAGRLLQTQAYEAACRHEEKFVAGLTAAERSQLFAILGKIRKAGAA